MGLKFRGHSPFRMLGAFAVALFAVGLFYSSSAVQAQHVLTCQTPSVLPHCPTGFMCNNNPITEERPIRCDPITCDDPGYDVPLCSSNEMCTNEPNGDYFYTCVPEDDDTSGTDDSYRPECTAQGGDCTYSDYVRNFCKGDASCYANVCTGNSACDGEADSGDDNSDDNGGDDAEAGTYREECTQQGGDCSYSDYALNYCQGDATCFAGICDGNAACGNTSTGGDTGGDDDTDSEDGTYRVECTQQGGDCSYSDYALNYCKGDQICYDSICDGNPACDDGSIAGSSTSAEARKARLNRGNRANRGKSNVRGTSRRSTGSRRSGIRQSLRQ